MDVGVFASLLNEQEQIGEVAQAIEDAVAKSFAEDRSRSTIILPSLTSVSEADRKHRAGICIRIFRVLRGDMRWSWQRAIDHVPQYLRQELDGTSWEPSARAAWTPPQ